MFCSKCGTQLNGNEKYCPKCGQHVNLVSRPVNPQNPSSWTPSGYTSQGPNFPGTAPRTSQGPNFPGTAPRTSQGPNFPGTAPNPSQGPNFPDTAPRTSQGPNFPGTAPNPYVPSSSPQSTPDEITQPKIKKASPSEQEHSDEKPTPDVEAPLDSPASRKYLPTIIFYAPLLLAGISIAICMFSWVNIHIPIDFVPIDFKGASFTVESNALSIATMLEYFVDDKEMILVIFRVIKILVFVAVCSSFAGCILMAKSKTKHRMLLIVGQIIFVIASLGFIIATFKTNTWIGSMGSGSSEPYQGLSFTLTPAVYLCLASAILSTILALIGKNK